ncbi:MAG TPA: polysaccharide deacetylase family protein [Fulvivirga sp.]|nr:polysaccharide deacetylase family protein [Fulvivirga sp.]
MFFHRTPWVVKKLYPTLTWQKPTTEKVIYLTFDDGPIPNLTEFVLDCLADYKAKATFFCVGDNLRKHNNIAQMVIDNGHKLGNHTYNHLNGWQTTDSNYIDNIVKCEIELAKLGQGLDLFRPPYGKIKRSQIKRLSGKKIMMWDVLTGDYSHSVTPEQCLKHSIQSTSKGSIVLFHDNIKAEKNLKFTVPRYIEHFKSQGFEFRSL